MTAAVDCPETEADRFTMADLRALKRALDRVADLGASFWELSKRADDEIAFPDVPLPDGTVDRTSECGTLTLDQITTLNQEIRRVYGYLAFAAKHYSHMVSEVIRHRQETQPDAG